MSKRCQCWFQSHCIVSAEAPIGGAKPVGPNLLVATQAIKSNTCWLWLHMFRLLSDLIGQMEAYFLTCPCHASDDGQQRVHSWQRKGASWDEVLEHLDGKAETFDDIQYVRLLAIHD